jgi:HEAT repeat protein
VVFAAAAYPLGPMHRPISSRTNEMARALDALARLYDAAAPFVGPHHLPSELFVEPRLVTRWRKREAERKPEAERDREDRSLDKDDRLPREPGDVDQQLAELYEIAAEASQFETEPWSAFVNRQSGLTLALLGCPGGGKSWAMHASAARMAADAATALRSGHLDVNEVRLPVLIPAQRIVDEVNGSAFRDLLGAAWGTAPAAALTGLLPPDAPESCPARFLVMIDGLDEVGVEDDVRVRRLKILLDKLVASGLPSVVSCRTGDWEEWEAAMPPAFQDEKNIATLEALTFRTQRLYLGQRFPHDPQFAACLLQQIGANPVIRDAARTPLLLEMIARVAAASELDQLGTGLTQSALYAQIIDLFLRGVWRPNTALPPWSRPKSPRRQALGWLSRVAFRLLQLEGVTGHNRFDEDAWSNACERACELTGAVQMTVGDATIPAAKFRDQLMATGLLIQASGKNGKERWSFAHRTLLEYLAACGWHADREALEALCGRRSEDGRPCFPFIKSSAFGVFAAPAWESPLRFHRHLELPLRFVMELLNEAEAEALFQAFEREEEDIFLTMTAYKSQLGSVQPAILSAERIAPLAASLTELFEDEWHLTETPPLTELGILNRRLAEAVLAPILREFRVKALGRAMAHAGPALLPTIIEALLTGLASDKSEWTRNDCAKALGKAAAHAAPALLPIIIEALLTGLDSDQDRFLPQMCAEALIKAAAHGSPAMLTSIAEALWLMVAGPTDSRESELARICGLALGEVAALADPALLATIVDGLLVGLANADGYVRYSCALALGEVAAHAGPALLPGIVEALLPVLASDESGWTRNDCAKALGKAAAHAGPALLPTIVGALITAFASDKSKWTRYDCAKALGKAAAHAGPALLATIVDGLLVGHANADGYVRHSCALALGEVAAQAGPALLPGIVEALLPVLASDEDDARGDRHACAKALGEAAAHAGPALLPTMVGALIEGIASYILEVEKRAERVESKIWLILDSDEFPASDEFEPPNIGIIKNYAEVLGKAAAHAGPALATVICEVILTCVNRFNAGDGHRVCAEALGEAAAHADPALLPAIVEALIEALIACLASNVNAFETDSDLHLRVPRGFWVYNTIGSVLASNVFFAEPDELENSGAFSPFSIVRKTIVDIIKTYAKALGKAAAHADPALWHTIDGALRARLAPHNEHLVSLVCVGCAEALGKAGAHTAPALLRAIVCALRAAAKHPLSGEEISRPCMGALRNLSLAQHLIISQAGPTPQP